MTAEEKARLLATCVRDCREEMRHWAHGWRKAPDGVLKRLYLRKAIALREAAEFYERGVSRLITKTLSPAAAVAAADHRPGTSTHQQKGHHAVNRGATSPT